MSDIIGGGRKHAIFGAAIQGNFSIARLLYSVGKRPFETWDKITLTDLSLCRKGKSMLQPTFIELL